eukprot:CAMPEP_0170538154 /NCGR_PEP_ID=MMETSP0209-20121228/103147_1 /TAXON_ID=665100 ORGANISM="Litonotus pictus, Strain P1" /NCGR_SAMPLE_ID=MMETSP0209 /ASSEMBLY_ACC=CAM_ASM_000301 /LENGTH=458 /DNA_ID=CAMNT_0010839799 /DNA_START=54 /DNA_END=1428 /DNA_ORIENTATION=+
MGHGSSEVSLTERGVNMAKLLACRLSEVEFKAVFSSDLKRAVETTKILLSSSELSKSNIEPEFSSELREKNLGVLEGKDPRQIKEDAAKKGVPLRKYKPEAGESWVDVFVRAKNFLNGIIKKHIKQDFIDPELQNLDSKSSVSLSNQFQNTVKIKHSQTMIQKNIQIQNQVKNKHLYESLKINKELKRDVTISGGLVEDSFVEDEKFESLKKHDSKNVYEEIKRKESTNRNTNSNTNSKGNTGTVFKEDKYEYYFLTKPIEKFTEDPNCKKYIQLFNKHLYESLKINKELKRDVTISGGLVEDSFVEDEKFESLKKHDSKNVYEEIKRKESTNSNTNSKGNTGTVFKEDKYEYYFLTKPIEKFTEDPNCKKYIQTIYKGFGLGHHLPRMLVISHGGFIMELMNVIRSRKGISIKLSNDSKFTSLYVLKIYCFACGGVCYSKDSSCKLEYDVIAYNNTR